MINHRDELENELDDMPMMSVDLPNALLLMGDAFDIDPILIIQALMGDEVMPDPPAMPELKEEYGAREVQLMVDMIFEGVDSSTYLPHILRSLQIISKLNDLDN